MHSHQKRRKEKFSIKKNSTFHLFLFHALFLLLHFSQQIIDDHYHMEHRSIAKRSISPSHHHQRRLNEDNRVVWSKQQTAKSRQKRDFTRLKPKSVSKLLNDPKWTSMWYLNVSIIDILKLPNALLYSFFPHALSTPIDFFLFVLMRLHVNCADVTYDCFHLAQKNENIVYN